MNKYQAKVEQIIHGHIDLPTSLAETNANIAIAKILALLDQRAVEAKIEETKLYKQYFNGRTRGYANSRIDELKSQQRISEPTCLCQDPIFFNEQCPAHHTEGETHDS